MRSDLLAPAADGQARLLLLIDAFSGRHLDHELQGRTKLAKLDFFLRYPDHLRRILAAREVNVDLGEDPWLTGTIEQRMVRYRFGPWDPAYYSLLGALTGKGLVLPLTGARGSAYRVSPAGRDLALALARTDSWSPVRARTLILHRHLNLTGNKLKNLIYQTFPEIVEADWGSQL